MRRLALLAWLSSCGMLPAVPGPDGAMPEPRPDGAMSELRPIDGGDGAMPATGCRLDAGYSKLVGEDGGAPPCPVSWDEATACCELHLDCSSWGACLYPGLGDYPRDGGHWYASFSCEPNAGHTQRVWTCGK